MRANTSYLKPVVFATIHKYLEVGFHPNTKIPMKDGTLKHIGKINLGEILANGEIVTGCVTILGDVPLYHHETDIIGTATLRSGHTPYQAIYRRHQTTLPPTNKYRIPENK